MTDNFKEEAEEWAKKVITEVTFNKNMLLEQMIYGSLLFALDKAGNKTWLKRIEGSEEYEIKPVNVINGVIEEL